MQEGKPIRRVVWGRRFLAATVVVPPSMAERLSTDALAVLAVIRDEAKETGRCDLPVARIAERANIGRAKARPPSGLRKVLVRLQSRKCLAASACSSIGASPPAVDSASFL